MELLYIHNNRAVFKYGSSIIIQDIDNEAYSILNYYSHLPANQ